MKKLHIIYSRVLTIIVFILFDFSILLCVPNSKSWFASNKLVEQNGLTVRFNGGRFKPTTAKVLL